MKRGNFIYLFIFLLVLSFVSAGLFSNFFGRSTGRVVSDSNCYGMSQAYLFLNKQTGGHFITIFTDERDNIIDSHGNLYGLENTVFFASSANFSGVVPLYRFWNKQTGGHFYTISEEEKKFIIDNYSDIFVFEDVAFYVFKEQLNGTIPVYRFWNSELGGHYYTVSEVERDRIIVNVQSKYVFEGVAFYVSEKSSYCYSKGGSGAGGGCKSSAGLSHEGFVNCIYYGKNCESKYDLNNDGVYSIVGDLPCYNNQSSVVVKCKSSAGLSHEGFVNCIYYGKNCESKYDLNNDGVYSIVGDLPCYNGENYSIEQKFCSDSDGPEIITLSGGGVAYSPGGIHRFIKGLVVSSNGTFEDFCDGEKLIEYACNQNELYLLQRYDCFLGCEDGKCKHYVTSDVCDANLECKLKLNEILFYSNKYEWYYIEVYNIDNEKVNLNIIMNNKSVAGGYGSHSYLDQNIRIDIIDFFENDYVTFKIKELREWECKSSDFSKEEYVRFTRCIYHGESCESKYDLNNDGVYSIVGDIPCYKGVIYPDEPEKSNSTCNGCLSNNNCFSFGHRMSGNYCSDDSKWIKQKTVDAQGGWANCENHYECVSNFCSSGECIEIVNMMQEVSSWAILGAKITCRFANMFNIEKYNDCIGQRVGKAYLSK
jgi:hypothetical protein